MFYGHYDDLDGLNPFFIRSVVGMAKQNDNVSISIVLIPSSSGLWLECVRGEKMTDRIRLNPFFIRSVVGINFTAGSSTVGVLIPSSSGLWLESSTTRNHWPRSSLNPFFIRSVVGIDTLKKEVQP